MVLDYPKFGTLQDKQKFLERVTDIAVRQYQIDPILVGQVLSTLNPLQDQKDLEAIIKQKNERNPDQLRKKVKDALNLTEGQAEEITDNQLKTLQGVVSNINQTQMEIGRLETQKHNMLHNLVQSQKALIDMQDEFEKNYGTYDINITDGSINYKDEQTDKKN